MLADLKQQTQNGRLKTAQNRIHCAWLQWQMHADDQEAACNQNGAVECACKPAVSWHWGGGTPEDSAAHSHHW